MENIFYCFIFYPHQNIYFIKLTESADLAENCMKFTEVMEK